MNIGLYFLIFISKVIENGLSTLRLIVVANGKKILGAFLQFVISLVWVLVTGIVVNDLIEDPLKVIFFALGSLVGSYAGSIIEEKIALGDILINCITNNIEVNNYIKSIGYNTSILKTDNKDILLFVIPRRKKIDIINNIKLIDKDVLIFSEKVKNFS
ncbi:MAG: hypothetical protein E7157_02250 [Lactobacillales bacterium]|nr:hypothetical protein [Lactobacillales bacterium]